jgi:tetratricopeptide (TPR) repeat protein
MGRAEEAIGLIQRAIYGMDSDDAILRDHLGDAYLLQGDTARAVAEWERAHRLDPELAGVAEKIEKHTGE